MKTESVVAMNTHTPPPPLRKLSKHKGGKVLFALFGLLMLGVAGQAKAQALSLVQGNLTFSAGEVISVQLAEATGGSPGYDYTLFATVGDFNSRITGTNHSIWSWDGATRTLSGKAAAAVSDSQTFEYDVGDQDGSGDYAQATFTLTVVPVLLETNIDLTFGVGSAVNYTLPSLAVYADAQYTIASFTVSSSTNITALNTAGLTFTLATGVLEGNPTAAVEASYTLRAYNGATARNTSLLSIVVLAKVGLSQQADIAFTAGHASTIALGEAAGGKTPYVYALSRPTGSVLPLTSILSLDTATAELTASASIAGSHAGNYILTVTDNDNETAATTFAIAVANPPTFPANANPGHQTFFVGTTPSDIDLADATGGSGTLAYTLTADGTAVATNGNIGVTRANYLAPLGNAPGQISSGGNAVAEDAVVIVYTATDANGASASFQFNFVVVPGPSVFATAQTDLEFTAGHARTFTLATASAGKSPYVYTLARENNVAVRAAAFEFVSGTTPELRSTTSLLKTDEGTDYILTATDANNLQAHSTFSIVVADELAFASGANPGNRAVLTTTASTITLGDADGGKATVAYVFSVGGTTRATGYEVVTGMTYTARSTGTAATISGTPTALNTGVDVTYIATDANNASVTFGFNLSVVDKPTFPGNFAATYTRNHPIYGSRDAISTSGDALTLPAATGGSGTPNYSVLDNSLPRGLSVRDLSDGRQVISGRPTQATTPAVAFSYARTATDANGVGTFVLTLHIADIVSFGASQSRVHFTASTPREVNLIPASGGVGDLVYSIDNLPAGLTLNTTSAALGATDSIAASHAGRYTLTATDTLGATAAASFDIQIAGELGIDVTGGMIDELTYIVGETLQLPPAEGGYDHTYSVTGLGAGVGLTFDANRRAIYGALTVATAANLTLTPTYNIEDANGAMVSDAFTLHIIPLKFANQGRELKFRSGEAQSFDLSDELTVAAGAGTDVYAIDPMPNEEKGLTYSAATNMFSIAEEFVVEDDTVLDYTLTATYIIGTGNTAVTHTATQTITLEAQGGGEKLAPVNEEVISKIAASVVGSTLAAITERIAVANIATPLALIGGQTPQTALANYAKAVADDADDNNALLTNSRFVLPFASLPSNANIGAIWGSTQMRELDGDVDAVDWSGDVSGLHLGVDFKVGENLIGVAVSKSDADIDYKTTDAQGNLEEGKYEVSLTALHPYINRKFGEVDYWASIGFGEGEMTVTEKGGDAIKSDLSLNSLGVGAGMQIESGLQLRAEAQIADIDIEGNDDFGLRAQNLSTNSVRALARWENIYLTSNVPLFTANQTAFFEAGMRRDSGDGESRRAAMETTIGWNYRGQRATIEAAMHGLVGRKDYREWGAYTNLRISGGDDGQGLSLRVRPSYGEAQGEFGRVWDADSFDDIVESKNDSTAYQWRTETRLSYGIQSAGGLVAPFVDAADDTYRLGVDWSPHRYFDVNLTGERRHSNDDADERRVLLQGEVKF